VHLVFTQDGAQMAFPEDQHAVQELTGHKPRQRGEPGPVSRLVPHPASVPPQDRVLVPEHEQLGIFRPVAAEHQDGQAKDPAREHVDDLEQHPAS
jgi:hypothetical protein